MDAASIRVMTPKFVESIWQGEINQLVIDFFDDGKKQGYVSQELSQEAISAFYEILRRGISSSPILKERMGANPKLAHDLIRLFAYGLNG